MSTVAAAVVCGVAVVEICGAAPNEDQSVARTIYASATHDGGRPVLDMSATDFEVKENGKVQEISVRLATAPLRVALIVSDRGTGAFQGGALRFCEALLGQAEISIVGLIVQPETLVQYSSSADALRRGLQQLGRRNVINRAGAQLVETIMEVAQRINRDRTRSAIVVMRAGGEAPTSVRVDHVRNALRESGAVLYVLNAASPNTYMSPADMAEGALTLPTILGDGSRESGGTQIEALGTRVVPAMQQIAAELVNQYEITYTLPAGTKPSDRISVSTGRRGVTVHAPSRIAN